MTTDSFVELLKNTEFDLRVLRGPSQIEIANSLFRVYGDHSKTISFVIEEDGPIDNGKNHAVCVVVTAVEHDFVGYFGELPDLYISGYCKEIDGHKIEDTSQFILVKVYFRQHDGLGRFKSRKV